MAKSHIWFLCFMSSILVNNLLQLEASHHVTYKSNSNNNDGNNNNLHFIHSESSANPQPYRTAYHFQPPKNWMNDPNGPMIYRGIYHLFYQYNPKGAEWGNIVWAHSTSTDLVNWDPHPPAIFPSQSSDINGCWSGSATILQQGKPVILYTGIDPRGDQVQDLAVPKNLSDPYLVEWSKSPFNPLMTPGANKLNASSFRDPTTAWLGPDGHWRVVVGNKRKRRGMALLYRSKDFVHWIKAKHPLFSSKNSGMMECPDFYPVSVQGENGVDTSRQGPPGSIRHVLKASLDDYKHDYYAIGTYDHQKDMFGPDNAGFVDIDSGLRYDYGKYYASKTFFDSAKNRRVLFGWVNESTNATIDIIKGWSGLQAIPRKIWLDKSGKQLVQWPVEEINKLRKNQVQPPITLLKAGSVVEISGVTASQADVEISFGFSTLNKAEVLSPDWSRNPQELCSQKGVSVQGRLGPFGLLALASKDIQEFTALFFRIFQDYDESDKFVVLMCSDQTRSSSHLDYDKTTYGAFLDVDLLKEKLSLRCLIDHSIVESFGGGGKVCITSRVYPTNAIEGEAHLYAFNYGTESILISSLSAWSMNKAHIN